MLFPNGNPLAAKVMIADQDEMIKVDHLHHDFFTGFAEFQING